MGHDRFLSHSSRCNMAFQEALEVWERAWRVPVLAILIYFFQTEGTWGTKLIVTRCERLCVFPGVGRAAGWLVRGSSVLQTWPCSRLAWLARVSFLLLFLFHFIEHIEAGSAEFYCGCSHTRQTRDAEKLSPSAHRGPQAAASQHEYWTGP